jgi:hypothetical protein
MNSSRFKQAIEKIDATNSGDPNFLELDGQKWPLEVVHAERRTAWIQRLVGDNSSETLLLAARAQHIRRWEIPRDRYLRDRNGYLEWRRELKKFHAEVTADILRDVGYEDDMIDRVQDLILKKRLKLDPEMQTLEDVLCLVFLETQFSEFAKQEADKISNIIRKTWRKMSARGQQLALDLPLAAEDRAILEKALDQ